MSSRRLPPLLFGLILALAAAWPAGAVSPALVLAPSPGLGIQAETRLWRLDLRLEATALTGEAGLTGYSLELDHPMTLNFKWLPVHELDLGARLSTTDKVQLLAALRRRFDLAQDLHFDLKLGICAPGVTYLGAAVVQDWF